MNTPKHDSTSGSRTRQDEASEPGCTLLHSFRIALFATINELCCGMSNIVKMTVFKVN